MSALINGSIQPDPAIKPLVRSRGASGRPQDVPSCPRRAQRLWRVTPERRQIMGTLPHFRGVARERRPTLHPGSRPRLLDRPPRSPARSPPRHQRALPTDKCGRRRRPSSAVASAGVSAPSSSFCPSISATGASSYFLPVSRRQVSFRLQSLSPTYERS